MSAALFVSQHRNSRDDLLYLLECSKLFTDLFVARNSDEALELLEEREIDVIFYDWLPPELGEINDLVGFTNDRDEWYDIPLIIFTPQLKKDFELLALQLGASDCFSYKISTRELSVRLYPHLNHKKRADSLREENCQLARMAITDRMTGLYNRSYFDLILEFESARCQRQQSVMTILVIGIDGLRQVVDQYGQAAADSLLRLVADVIHGTARQSDIACRYSHVDFALILPGTMAPDAFRLAERIRKQVSKRGPKPPLSSFQATVSVGISGGLIESGLDAPRLVEEAFCAIDTGVRNGANRTEIFCHSNLIRTSSGLLVDLDHPQGRA